MALSELILADSAARTASGTGEKIAVKTGTMMAMVLNCTSVTAGANLDVDLEWSPDSGTSWYAFPADFVLVHATTVNTLIAGAAATKLSLTTAAGSVTAVYKHLPGGYVRTRWTLSGTSYTFSVKASVK